MWDRFLSWRGVAAIAVFAAVTLWLAIEGKLGFYIHPRYNVFTIVMSAIAVVLFVIAAVTQRPHADDHAHHSMEPRRRRRTRVVDVASFATVLATLAALVVLPPTTLSSATAANRSANDVGVVSPAEDIDESGAAEMFAALTVRDWAGLLLRNQSPAFYRGKPVDVIGIVTPSSLSPDVFLLTRFVVTCCAVDAQPVSVPVYQPGWSATIGVDSWVRVQGGFQPGPASLGSGQLVVVPVEISPEEVPREPYLF